MKEQIHWIQHSALLHLIFLGIFHLAGDFIERVVTQDETAVHRFVPELKIPSKQ